MAARAEPNVVLVSAESAISYATRLDISHTHTRTHTRTHTVHTHTHTHTHAHTHTHSVPIGVLFSVLFGLLWVSPLIEQPAVSGDPLGVCLFALAALMELTVEPLWVMGQLQQYVTLKVGPAVCHTEGRAGSVSL